MADNWSASVLTLANKGDWAKWTIDVPDADAAAMLNENDAARNLNFALRGALTAASRTARAAIIVNDVAAWPLGVFSIAVLTSGGSWVNANRYAGLGALSAQGFALTDFDTLDDALYSQSVIAPFVVGTNTIRILSYDAEDLEIDFFGIQVAYVTPFLPTVINVPFPFPAAGGGYGTDSASESTPAGFAAHTNPDGDFPGAPPNYAWLLKAPEATTGTATSTAIEVRKFCTHGATTSVRVRLFDASNIPLAGVPIIAIAIDNTVVNDTTDADGFASFEVNSGVLTSIAYGGADNNAPALVEVPDSLQIGCGGWHVGRIGVG